LTQLKDFTHVSTLAAQTAPDHPGPVPPRVRLKLTTINPARGCSPAPQPLPYPRHPRDVPLSLGTTNKKLEPKLKTFNYGPYRLVPLMFQLFLDCNFLVLSSLLFGSPKNDPGTTDHHAARPMMVTTPSG
jgi:hypothetical protein